MKLYLDQLKLKSSDSLIALGVNDQTMIKARSDGKDDSVLNCSSGSTRSLIQKESNSDSSLSSGSRKSLNEIDFSIYAVPET